MFCFVRLGITRFDSLTVGWFDVDSSGRDAPTARPLGGRCGGVGTLCGRLHEPSLPVRHYRVARCRTLGARASCPRLCKDTPLPLATSLRSKRSHPGSAGILPAVRGPFWTDRCLKGHHAAADTEVGPTGDHTAKKRIAPLCRRRPRRLIHTADGSWSRPCHNAHSKQTFDFSSLVIFNYAT